MLVLERVSTEHCESLLGILPFSQQHSLSLEELEAQAGDRRQETGAAAVAPRLMNMVYLGPVGPVGRAEQRSSYLCALLDTTGQLLVPHSDHTTPVSYFPWVPVPGLLLHYAAHSCKH